MSLPVESVLPDLLETLDRQANAVLVAPPGAGKTTMVAPVLLDRSWCRGEILLLSPRRLAARAAAERIAELRGEKVGGVVGYATRLDTKRSAATRLLVLTEGIFLKRVQSDPELSGVSAVLFDEVHERSLDMDFSLALALDAQKALRPDLRLLAMSATLDGGRFSALMGGAPVIESKGRSHTLEILHIGRRAEARLETEMAAACRRALAEHPGSLLAFLPGVAEIERTADLLGALPADVCLHRLHGSLDPREQRAAIGPAPSGTRKLVLATAIAETSLTLDGVRIVVDSGLARRPRYDRSAGLTRLVTERASQASVTQRAGRAGRQGPGLVLRLWEASATAALPPFDPPEIQEADLSSLVLECAIWGTPDPRELDWLDPPSQAAIAEARKRLQSLGALTADHRPTAHGRAISTLPLPTRLAHMMIEAGKRGWTEIAAEAAVLTSERGLGGSEVDLELRRSHWRREHGSRAEAARGLARRWRSLVETSPAREEVEIGACVALAFPDRVSRRRSGEGSDWLSVGGRGFKLDPASSLASEDWLAVAEVSGTAAGARILSAAPISLDRVEQLFADRIETGSQVRFDPATLGLRASRGRRLGAILLSGGPDPRIDPDQAVTALLQAVRDHGLDLLPWPQGAEALRRRAAFARSIDPALEDLGDAALMARLDEWLAPMLHGRKSLAGLESELAAGLETLLGWEGKRRIDRLAPSHFETPAGSRHPIDYEAAAGPTVTARPQAFFGLDRHPCIGDGRIPLVLSLTSPAGRPIQTTRDLPGFWRGSWKEVVREMRGRYPRHPWPDDPAAADPTLRTKKASGR